MNESFTVNGTMATLINESGLYALVFRSKQPWAKKFQHWVTSEVLPSIRKHGMYAIDDTYWTQDGRKCLYEFLKRKGVMPIAERLEGS